MSRSEDDLDDDPREVDRLRRELVRRLDHHPFPAWSAALLRAVISVIDLAQPIPPRPVGRPLLQVVK